MTEEIRDLVNFAQTSKSPKNKKLVIGFVENDEADFLKAKTGFKLAGFKHIIDKFGINHTLKNHGNVSVEKQRGQIAVTESDFIMIPEIIKSENVIYANKNKSGNDCILYEYILGDVFYYVVEIRQGRKELCIQTMYKRKP